MKKEAKSTKVGSNKVKRIDKVELMRNLIILLVFTVIVGLLGFRLHFTKAISSRISITKAESFEISIKNNFIRFR